MNSLKEHSLDRVLDELNRDAEHKKDFFVETSNLIARNDGRITLKNTNEVYSENGTPEKNLDGVVFDTTDWADNQLLSRLGMPAAYFRKAKEADPELFAQHFNYWTNVNEDRIRLRTKMFTDQALIRGAVSTKYAPLDNVQVGEIMEKILRENKDDFEINDFYLDDRRFHLRLSYPTLTKNLRTLPDGNPDYSRIGTDIVNSEVGAASFNLTALLWRLICSNGLRGWGRDWTFVQRHIHLRPIEFQSRVAEAMVKSLDASQDLLDEYQKMQEQQIENPFNAIKRLAEEGDFSSKFTDVVKEQYEGDNTAYGVVNAFTRAARELPNEQRLDAEKFAGKLIRFPASKWKQVQTEEMVGEGIEDEAVV